MPPTNVPIKKLGERRYQVRYRDQDGKQHKPVFPTHREALAHWQEATTQSRQGTYIDPKAGTELLSSFGSKWGDAQDWKDTTRQRFLRALTRAVDVLGAPASATSTGSRSSGHG